MPLTLRTLPLLVVLALTSSLAKAEPEAPPSASYLAQVDDLSALWSRYKYAFVDQGRVVEHDEREITTSEGQSYAMLRAVWSDDRATFAQVWQWTSHNLQVRDDRLFAWKWLGGRVVDKNSATDADVDIALALVLASRRFHAETYLAAALPIIRDIGRIDIAKAGDRYVVTAGSWTVREDYPQIHVAYLAPYAYEDFASLDQTVPWSAVAAGSYDLLHWLYFEQNVRLPPEFVFVDRRDGRFLLAHPKTHQQADFSYDAVPLFWRIAQDHSWFGRTQHATRHEGNLSAAMLAFFDEEWHAKGRFVDRYTIFGAPKSLNEGLPFYATVHALARAEGKPLADEIARHKLAPLWDQALDGKPLPYYLHNWLWFDRAQDLQMTRSFDEFLGFLRPFDAAGFWAHLPLAWLAAALALFFLARFHPLLKLTFLLASGGLCVRYLVWRLCHSLNFAEPVGPTISITLWLAEAYGFVTALLLWLQVGLKPQSRPVPTAPADFLPTVDVMIPIYSESLAILEATLVGATNLDYPSKTVYVCDDSHRDSVRQLAEEFGAVYVKGPKRHAKAGNLNHALTLSRGELVVVFDTDHIPCSHFLRRTTPWFAQPRCGVVQTPHVFYNEDIFQRALGSPRRVGNEQDMFNHAIQSGRDAWGGAFFVGSGAVFRRTAINEVGGFNLLSITEDIHTSQLLHAKGWTSAFVDENLAVGLSAESLAGFIVQRRRWMLGCLQIFFKDNPLFVGGLTLRHRLGYLASLSYFFFPAARVVFWLTPIWYLLFHWHPLLADVSVLFAYLVPFLIIRPLMTAALVPGWPRALWGTVYETVCSFALFRSMFDLFLPKSLGFKVTPKGVTSQRRTFDALSSRATLIATAISVLAIAKGLLEFNYFGIEKEAYFLNIAWALVNLLFLLASLLIAWERPQKRQDERVARRLPVHFGGTDIGAVSTNISLSGLALHAARDLPTTDDVNLALMTPDGPLSVTATLVYQEAGPNGGIKAAYRFHAISSALRRQLIRELFTRPETWERRHQQRTRSSLRLAWLFGKGLCQAFVNLRHSRRQTPRRWQVRPLTFVEGRGGRRRLLQRDRSAAGLCLYALGTRPNLGTGPLAFLSPEGGHQWLSVVYVRRRLPGLWRLGLAKAQPPAGDPCLATYLTV